MDISQKSPIDPRTKVRDMHDHLDHMAEAVGMLAGFLDQVPDVLPELRSHLGGNLALESLTCIVSEASGIRRELNDLQRYLDANATVLAEVQA